MTDHMPPQHGLTKKQTGWKHPLFPDWDIEDDEMRAIERRARYRHTDAPAAPELPYEPSPFVKTTPLPERTCRVCDTVFRPTVKQQAFCTKACRRKDESTRRYGKQVAS